MPYRNIFLSIGSNEGDRRMNLERAKILLSERVVIVKESGIYETEPWGRREQSPFYNQVLMVETELTPHELLSFCLFVENKMGRIRREKWGSRVIDIDILAFGDILVSDAALELPHRYLAERRFELVPFSEIAGDFFVMGRTVRELLEGCEDKSWVRRVD